MAKTVYDSCVQCGGAGFVYDTDIDGNLTVQCECPTCVARGNRELALQSLATQVLELNMGYGPSDPAPDADCVPI